MAFYHGTNLLIGNIDLSKCRNRTDFGNGFYLTDKLETAYKWAANKMEFADGIATVLRYEINNKLFTVNGKKFNVTPDLEWLEFICSNRNISLNIIILILNRCCVGCQSNKFNIRIQKRI